MQLVMNRSHGILMLLPFQLCDKEELEVVRSAIVSYLWRAKCAVYMNISLQLDRL